MPYALLTHKTKTGSFIMVKKMAIALLCTVLGSSLYANDISENARFLGLEVGAATVQADTGGIFGESDFKGSGAEFGLRIGAQSEEWRTMFVFDYYDNSDDAQKYAKGLLQIDYFFLAGGAMEKSRFNPYMGINGGYMNYESVVDSTIYDIDESGFLYGGQVGLTVGLMDSVDLDIMYRYSLTDAAQTNHIESFVFGINYIY